MATFVEVAKAADVEPAVARALKSMAGERLFNVQGPSTLLTTLVPIGVDRYPKGN